MERKKKQRNGSKNNISPNGKILRDCRYYRGDRPCFFHKTEGVKCEDCPHYSPFSEKILMIKLDALGDVLRTTSLLPGLKDKYPKSHITWITRKDSLPLFGGNSLVDRVLPVVPEGLVSLSAENFSVAVNLDTSFLSAGLMTIASAERKFGFGLDELGQVRALNAEAEAWLRMSVFDDLKKSNRRTYQAIARKIAGISPPEGEIIIRLLPAEAEFAAEFAARHGYDRDRLHIGLNTGAGGRWKHKKWTREGTLALARLCRDRLNAQLLLYGGPEEEERNRWLLSRAEGILIDTGCHNSLREFFSLLNLSDLMVTSDSLALHAALGLKKKVVALFGPTSSAEVEMYGRGEKVVTPLACRCCYLTDCAVEPDCMESITPEMVFAAVRKLMRSG